MSAATLRTLAGAFRSGQLPVPVSAFAISKIARVPDALVTELQRMQGEGMAPAHLALLLETAAGAVEAKLMGAASAELVWTGPESAIAHSRDTAVVVEELFAAATRSVLVSTFVIQQGARVFRALASRMESVPALQARLFVHVNRDWKDTRHESEILREFGDRFREQWPGSRSPEVYYDPRTLSNDADLRATWHAKCVLVDDEVSFVTSANFTEWAHQKNVEAGVLIRSSQFTKQFRTQFESLVQAKAVRRLPGF